MYVQQARNLGPLGHSRRQQIIVTSDGTHLTKRFGRVRPLARLASIESCCNGSVARFRKGEIAVMEHARQTYTKEQMLKCPASWQRAQSVYIGAMATR